MENKSRKATTEIIPFECTSEDEEEAIERLNDEAMDVAGRVVAELFEANQVSSLEYHASGGYHHVWLVTCSTVCDLIIYSLP